jgi:hypothetical protein
MIGSHERMELAYDKLDQLMIPNWRSCMHFVCYWIVLFTWIEFFSTACSAKSTAHSAVDILTSFGHVSAQKRNEHLQ